MSQPLPSAITQARSGRIGVVGRTGAPGRAQVRSCFPSAATWFGVGAVAPGAWEISAKVGGQRLYRRIRAAHSLDGRRIADEALANLITAATEPG